MQDQHCENKALVKQDYHAAPDQVGLNEPLISLDLLEITSSKILPAVWFAKSFPAIGKAKAC